MYIAEGDEPLALCYPAPTPHTLLEASPMILLKIILAIFLPPVAAFLQVGVSTHFWINIILTLLGVFPGMVHAIWLIATDQKG
jgi:uncharacterized membrane protein YqaE (UPF0057 family)